MESSLVQHPSEATLRHVTTIVDWPADPYTQSRVPSKIAYDSEDSVVVRAWGCGVLADMEEAYSWFKLHLDAHVAANKYDIVVNTEEAKAIRTGADELPEGLNALEVITYFMALDRYGQRPRIFQGPH